MTNCDSMTVITSLLRMDVACAKQCQAQSSMGLYEDHQRSFTDGKMRWSDVDMIFDVIFAPDPRGRGKVEVRVTESTKLPKAERLHQGNVYSPMLKTDPGSLHATGTHGCTHTCIHVHMGMLPFSGPWLGSLCGVCFKVVLRPQSPKPNIPLVDDKSEQNGLKYILYL